VIVAVANLITTAIFLLYLSPQGSWAFSGLDYLAAGNGLLFFLGQWFSIQAMKSGDIAVHSSALGIKVLIVAALSFMVGLEPKSWSLLTGVILAVLSVYLVAGGSASGWKQHRQTVWLTLLACFFFGINDFMTGWLSREIGAARWLTIMLSTSGIISLGLLLTRRKQLGFLYQSPATSGFVFVAGILVGAQALLVNLAFSGYAQPTLSNVVYSSRGVTAVIFLWLIGRQMDPRFRTKQLTGSALMIVALAVVLTG